MGVRSEYGFNHKEHQHALFRNKRNFRVIFEGYGTVDNSPDVNLYLLVDGKYQGLYIPPSTVGAIKWTCAVYAGSTLTVQEELGSFTVNSSGDITYTGGAIGTIDPTVTPTVNSTVDAIEVVVSDADSEQATYIVAVADIIVIDTAATGQSKLPTAATATLAAAE